MSLDDRIRRGLHHSVDQLMLNDGSIEVALTHVKSVTVRRQRIRVIALATALVAVVVALAASQGIGRLLLTVDPDLPPAEERDRPISPLHPGIAPCRSSSATSAEET